MPAYVRVGIDLGTSTSEVAYFDTVANRVIHVPLGEGRFIAPSAVLFDSRTGRIVVGSDAYAVRVARSSEVALHVKRHMGDPNYRFRLPAADGTGSPFKSEYTPAEVSAEILKYLKAQAERYADGEVRQAVIAVPAKFGTLDREHTEKAAQLAGLETLMLLPEPVAALVGYRSMRLGTDRDHTVMVYDFGGGTFDCTVMRAHGHRYQVLSKAGERDLGGVRIDDALAERFIRPRLLAEGFDPGVDPGLKQAMLDAAERAKISLSDEEMPKATALLTNLQAPGRPPRTIRVEITQEELQETIAPLLRAANEQMSIALERAGLSRDELDAVILVGGSTRLPAIRRAVREFIGEQEFDERERSPAGRKVFADADPDLTVSRGAALVARQFGASGQPIELVDILLDNVYVRVPGSARRFQLLFARGTDVEAARRDLRILWPQGDTAGLDLYEGESEGAPGARYVGTIRVGPVSLRQGTPVVLTLRYRTDRALPEASAKVHPGGDPLPATMVYEQNLVGHGATRLQLTRELDLVFCIDTTGSMVYGGHLERFRQYCAGLVSFLAESSLDVRLATVSFGDRSSGEREQVYSFTPDHRLFMTRLGGLKENDGGDAPESALDAVETAMRLPLRDGDTTKRRIVLVSDAPPHRPEHGSLETLVSGLAARRIQVDVAGPFCQEYDSLVSGTGGRYYDLDDGLEALFADLRESVRSASEGTGDDGVPR